MISTAVYSQRCAGGSTSVDLVGLSLWVLSVRHARRHFKKLVLITDQDGANLLAGALQLPFDEVSVSLNDCETAFPHIWALGKMYAYAQMAARGESFVHLDQDVICWKPLPDYILSAKVCATMVEPLPPGHPRRFSYPASFLNEMPLVPWPARVFARNESTEHAIQTSIFGGTDLAFIADYVAVALDSLHDPANAEFWPRNNGTLCSVFLEQYWLAALASYRGRLVETLVSEADLHDPSEARFRDLGFTHVWGDSKRLSPHRELVLQRCQANFPADFERCRALAN